MLSKDTQFSLVSELVLDGSSFIFYGIHILSSAVPNDLSSWLKDWEVIQNWQVAGFPSKEAAFTSESDSTPSDCELEM